MADGPEHDAQVRLLRTAGGQGDPSVIAGLSWVTADGSGMGASPQVARSAFCSASLAGRSAAWIVAVLISSKPTQNNFGGGWLALASGSGDWITIHKPDGLRRFIP